MRLPCFLRVVFSCISPALFLFGNSLLAAKQTEEWRVATGERMICLSTLPERFIYWFMLGAEARRGSIDQFWTRAIAERIDVDTRIILYENDFDLLTGKPVLPFQSGTFADAFAAENGPLVLVRHAMAEEKRMRLQFGRLKGQAMGFHESTFPSVEYLTACLNRLPQTHEWARIGLQLLVRTSQLHSLEKALGAVGANEEQTASLFIEQELTPEKFFAYAPSSARIQDVYDRAWAKRAAQLCLWGTILGDERRKEIFWEAMLLYPEHSSPLPVIAKTLGQEEGTLWREISTANISSDPLGLQSSRRFNALIRQAAEDERATQTSRYSTRTATRADQAILVGECLLLHALKSTGDDRVALLLNAESALATACSDDREPSTACLLQAYCQLQLGRLESAERLLERCMDVTPLYERAALTLSKVKFLEMGSPSGGLTRTSADPCVGLINQRLFSNPIAYEQLSHLITVLEALEGQLSALEINLLREGRTLYRNDKPLSTRISKRLEKTDVSATP